MSGVLVTRQKVTTLDKIRKFYLKGEESVTLSPKQDEIRKNVYAAWNLMLNYHSREQAMQVMMNSSNDGLGCSRAQAYRYVTDAMSVFGNPVQNQKEAKRYLIEEDLKRLQQRAIRDKDGALELNVIKQMIKIGRFDKDDNPNFDPEKIKAQTYILKIHPLALSALEKVKDGGVLNFNSVDAEDIEHEDVTDEETD